ncbi:arf-GAP with Rho-GAP domain, ANK repeat and PH domain-containing protein 2 [Spea bombifrons]|uniref:arf-GAP with Rho-GAP domain, ANK repeat and PH domain-containing protein 2 n=1 Tax=Spea bombifrons TaxID=233779 RepID=UPI00234916FD|nr:arf-GAP with Rho-GAP domain, ANK repeat and PH domain-containing protein 2 [Spea bombifrons]
MTSCNENKYDVGQMLSDIHLHTYQSIFQAYGYQTVFDCEKLNHKTLQEIGITLTGHRKRILNKIQSVLGNESGNTECDIETEEKTTCILASERADSKKQNGKIINVSLALTEQHESSTKEEHCSEGVLEITKIIDPSVQPGFTYDYLDKQQLTSAATNYSDCIPGNNDQDGLEDESFFEFQGPMVENELYSKTTDDSSHKHSITSVPSRSFILRNRPVPELPRVANEHRNTHTGEENMYPISPYEETFFNSSELTTEFYEADTILTTARKNEVNEEDSEINASTTSSHNDSMLPQDNSEESLYSTMEECSRELGLNVTENLKGQSPTTTSTKQGNVSLHQEDSISPYACFYGPPINKAGWLDKLSRHRHRTYMFQKRWVKLEGENISYYNTDKDVFSKGKISVSAISRIQMVGENKFEIITPQRTFVFRVEKDGDRQDWINTLRHALKSKPDKCPTLNVSDKNGYLELKGYKNKIFTMISGNKLWLSKSKQDAASGIYITDIKMTMINIKDADRNGFEIITPFKKFCFTAESEGEKQEWIESVQQCITETLADYEVAEKIWFNESNTHCADCEAPNPDWASINLGVVICKNCAGQHRMLGSKVSKVHSLKLDYTIWSNELVELFIVVGNEKVNSYWEANLLSGSNTKPHGASNINHRRLYITQKYKEGRFKQTYNPKLSQRQLNEALCASVMQSDVFQTMELVFSGADVMYNTGDAIHSTPYLLAKQAGQRLQMEFLNHNRYSDYKVLDYQPDRETTQRLYYCGFLYKASSKVPSSNKKLNEDMKKWWCTIEDSFLYYHENENTPEPEGGIDLSEVICLVIHSSDPCLHSGAFFTFEIYLLSERVFLFGSENVESQIEWTKAIAENVVPAVPKRLLALNFSILGFLHYKHSYSLNKWKEGWFALDMACLHYCHDQGNDQEDCMQLKKLQELTTSESIVKGEKRNTILLVESGRILYIHGHTAADFMIWHSAIEKAAGTDGNALQDQQLSKNNIPIIVNSCIAFVTQYGLGSKSLYLKNGNPLHVKELLGDFKKDARSIKLKVGKHQLEDVTDVLKCFLYEIDDALLTKELYPYWISALDIQDVQERVIKYQTIIDTLSELNKATLAALIEHLYRIQKCSDVNHLDPQILASAFSSCLFQTNGQNDAEVAVVRDLITHYVKIFHVSEEQLQQMDTENRFITKWKDCKITQSGDLLIEVYLERKDPDSCIIIRVSPTVSAAELANCVVGIRNLTLTNEMLWSTFEVIENGDLERLMHYKEKVLETVLQWSLLPDPGAAYLLIKPFSNRELISTGKKSLYQMHTGYVKYKEEPSKLLAGNKFQDRYFVLRERKLLLYKDIKSIKPEKMLAVVSCKLYIGVKRKLKPPTSFGLTIYFENHQWHLCCDSKETQMEWLYSLLNAQHPGDVFPRTKKSEQPTTNQNSKMKEFKMEQEKDIVQMKHMDDNAWPDKIMLRIKQALSKEDLSSTLKQRASMLTELENKEEGRLTKHKKHYSLVNLSMPSNYDGGEMHSKDSDFRDLDQCNKKPLASKATLPPTLIKELSSVIQKKQKREDGMNQM